MYSKNSKTSHLYRLVLNLTNKIELLGGDKCVVLSVDCKNVKKSYRNNNFLQYKIKTNPNKTFLKIF